MERECERDREMVREGEEVGIVERDREMVREGEGV